MAVEVRLFAALREAAGTARTQVRPGPLSAALEELSARYGRPFAELLPSCSVLVDGQPASGEVELAPGAELVLLPPVSGGGAPAASHDARVGARTALLSAGVPVLLLVALLAGRGWFVAAVVAVSCWVALDVSDLLAAAAARPVLLAAALPALGMPVAAAFRPEAGWEHVPGWLAAGFLLASGLMLVSGRRRHVVAGLGATLTVSLLVGLGAAALILLLALPAGFRWVLAVLVTIGAAGLGGALAAPLLGVQPVAGAGVCAGGASAAATFALQPPFEPLHGLMLAVTGLVAVVGGGEAQHALAVEAGRSPDPPGLGPGSGGPLAAASAVLLAAPVAYVVARAAAF